MNIFTVGRFHIEISDPYPVRVTVADIGGGGDHQYDPPSITLDHTDIADLAYAVRKAMHECRRMLPYSMKAEVGVI